MMAKNTRYVIQRTSDQAFWAGDDDWVRDPRVARKFRSRGDAERGCVLDYTGPQIAFTAVVWGGRAVAVTQEHS